MARWIVWGAAVVLLLGGCADYRESKKQEGLNDTLRHYAAALRWGYFETAYGFRDPQAAAVDRPEGLDNVRVTDYQVVQGPRLVGEDEARQTVRIEFVHRDVQRVRTLTDSQIWRYETETQRWLLQTPVPRFE